MTIHLHHKLEICERFITHHMTVSYLREIVIRLEIIQN